MDAKSSQKTSSISGPGASAESNYILLLKFANWLCEPNACPEDAAEMECGSVAVWFRILSRDDKQRPERVVMTVETNDEVMLVYVQLNHNYRLAVALEFKHDLEGQSAFDHAGRLSASRLAELTEALGSCLRDRLGVSLRPALSDKH